MVHHLPTSDLTVPPRCGSFSFTFGNQTDILACNLNRWTVQQQQQEKVINKKETRYRFHGMFWIFECMRRMPCVSKSLFFDDEKPFESYNVKWHESRRHKKKSMGSDAACTKCVTLRWSKHCYTFYFFATRFLAFFATFCLLFSFADRLGRSAFLSSKE